MESLAEKWHQTAARASAYLCRKADISRCVSFVRAFVWKHHLSRASESGDDEVVEEDVENACVRMAKNGWKVGGISVVQKQPTVFHGYPGFTHGLRVPYAKNR